MMHGRPYGGVFAAKEDNSTLWHHRLGHMSEKGMQLLAKAKVIPAIEDLPEMCGHCMIGKQRRASFSMRSSRRKRPLDLVHTDVCSIGERSLGGASYFVTFIDDYSRKVWAFALKSKDQVLHVFKTWHATWKGKPGRN